MLQHGDGSVAGNRKEGHCHNDVSGRGVAGCHTVKYHLAGIRQVQIQAGHLTPNLEAMPRFGADLQVNYSTQDRTGARNNRERPIMP